MNPFFELFFALGAAIFMTPSTLDLWLAWCRHVRCLRRWSAPNKFSASLVVLMILTIIFWGIFSFLLPMMMAALP